MALSVVQPCSLEGKKTKADIVLGLDNFFWNKLKNVFLHQITGFNQLDLPTIWTNKTLTFDFGNYAFSTIKPNYKIRAEKFERIS